MLLVPLEEFVLQLGVLLGATAMEEAERSSDDFDATEHIEGLRRDLLTVTELDEFDDVEQASLIKRSRISKSMMNESVAVEG